MAAVGPRVPLSPLGVYGNFQISAKWSQTHEKQPRSEVIKYSYGVGRGLQKRRATPGYVASSHQVWWTH